MKRRILVLVTLGLSFGCSERPQPTPATAQAPSAATDARDAAKTSELAINHLSLVQPHLRIDVEYSLQSPTLMAYHLTVGGSTCKLEEFGVAVDVGLLSDASGDASAGSSESRTDDQSGEDYSVRQFSVLGEDKCIDGVSVDAVDGARAELSPRNGRCSASCSDLAGKTLRR